MVHDPKSTETDTEDFQMTGDLFTPCLLLSARRDYRFSMIENMLKESNIPFFTRGRGPDGYLKVVSGYSMIYDTELYVYKRDYEQAKDMIDAFFSDAEPDGGYPAAGDLADEDSTAGELTGEDMAVCDLTDADSVTEDDSADSGFNRRSVARIFITIALLLLLAVAIYAAIMTFQQYNNPSNGTTAGTTSVTTTVQQPSKVINAVQQPSNDI